MTVDFQSLWVSVKLSVITTIILMLVGVPLSYWLAETRSKIKPFLEAIISLPLVLPPSVLGFYLLISFTPRYGLGKFLNEYFNLTLVFSFEGLIIASVLYSFPFMIHPVQSGFQHLPSSLKDAAYTLGVSKFRTFTKVLLPNIKPALLTGIVLTFAHTMGEFGVVMMIGGNIAGVTKVASISIYDEVESMNYENAHGLAVALLMISFIMLSALFLINKKFNRQHLWL